jgi:hypothetical protein
MFAAAIAAFRTSWTGDGAKWPAIYDPNNPIIGNNPALILAGPAAHDPGG